MSGLEAIGRMPFQTHENIVFNPYGSPPPIFPNSENIPPPVSKNKVRVVEPSTRTPVDFDPVEHWQERVDRLRDEMRHAQILRYKTDGSIDVDRPDTGRIINRDA
ncbi:MAG: hypothetical protein CBB72_011790 [Muricauda sp. TMED12]|nr:MAG: hypothetical protein CBB72_011790 [Muricauda sp. TMED12]